MIVVREIHGHRIGGEAADRGAIALDERVEERRVEEGEVESLAARGQTVVIVPARRQGAAIVRANTSSERRSARPLPP